MNQLIVKKDYILFKNQEFCAGFEAEPHFQAVHNTVVSIFESYFSIRQRKKIVFPQKKTNYKQK